MMKLARVGFAYDLLVARFPRWDAQDATDLQEAHVDATAFYVVRIHADEGVSRGKVLGGVQSRRSTLAGRQGPRLSGDE